MANLRQMMPSLSQTPTLVNNGDEDDEEDDDVDEAKIPTLWEDAFQRLDDEERAELDTLHGSKAPNLSSIFATVKEKKEECVKKQWVLFTNGKGETIMIREILGRIIEWVDKFKEVGDIAIQYDPGHAALPWAAVRFLLQLSVNDSQTFGRMLEGAERVANIVTIYTELETRVLIRTSVLTSQLSAALIKLYAATLKFLSRACHYYKKRTLKRILKSAVHSAKDIVDDPVIHIEKQEEEVFKLVTIVQNECLNSSMAALIANIKLNLLSPRVSVEERRTQLAARINAIDNEISYETALQNHHDGTCEWALQLGQLKTWASPDPDKGKLLWIHGPPGFGKTFLSAWIIQHLKAEKKTKPVAYFFCVADNQPTRDPYAILRSWLSQLLRRDDRVAVLLDSYLAVRSNSDQDLTHQDLWQLWRHVGENISDCTFVVDGFDECTYINSGARYHTKDPRNNFLRDLVANLGKTQSRVLVVSRDVSDIREILSKKKKTFDAELDDENGVEMYEYQITAEDTFSDVGLFSAKIINDRLPRKPDALKRKIANEATERSAGMFLWIKLLENEISPDQNAKELNKTVLEMPAGISEAYTREVERIIQLSPRKKDKAVNILRWVMFAIRPLQVKELVEALVVSNDDDADGDDEMYEYPYDSLPDEWSTCFVDEEYVKETILGYCGSLLELRSKSDKENLANRTIHFVHFSVKEYLSSLQAADPLARSLGIGKSEVEETRLARTCLRYLTLGVFREIPVDTHTFPFLSYASWAWYFHAYLKKQTLSHDISHWTRKAFDPTNSNWKVWTPTLEKKVLEPDDKQNESASKNDDDDDDDEDDEDDEDSTSNDAVDDSNTGSDNEDYEPNSSGDVVDKLVVANVDQAQVFTVLNPIYYASLLGLAEVLVWLEDQGLDCCCGGGRFGFPLQAAIARNHEAIVRHLLDRHVNITQQGGQYGSAIGAAAAVSTPEILKILLDKGTNLNSRDGAGWSPLHYASKRGSKDIVKTLLSEGALVNALTNFDETALSLACEFGNADVVEVLLANKANVAIANVARETPLHVAILNGHDVLACTLLDAGAPTDSIESTGYTPLILAISNNCFGAVKKMLALKVDVQYSHRTGWTALHQAAGAGNLIVVQDLLKAGADSTRADSRGLLPLHIAVSYGHQEVTRELLECQISAHGTEAEAFRAMCVATEVGNLPALEMLLGKGILFNRIDESSQTTLFDMALENEHQEIAEFLLKHGCVQIRKYAGATAKLWANIGADDQRDAGVKLMMMVFCDNIQGIKELPKDGKKFTKAHQDALWAALCVATARGNKDIVDHILEGRLFDLNQRDTNGRTVLHYAICNSHEKIAFKLVDEGASVWIEDDSGSTPIDLAARQGMRNLNFIRHFIGEWTLTIKRRPSLLEYTTDKRKVSTSSSVRRTIAGIWTGEYEYLAWMRNRKDPFTIAIPPPQTPSIVPDIPAGAQDPVLQNCTFSIEDAEDLWGACQYHGFTDEKGTVWFVKLYEQHGWIYRGELVPGSRKEGEVVDKYQGTTMRGTWGGNRKLWFGTFELRKNQEEETSIEAEDLQKGSG